MVWLSHLIRLQAAAARSWALMPAIVVAAGCAATTTTKWHLRHNSALFLTCGLSHLRTIRLVQHYASWAMSFAAQLRTTNGCIAMLFTLVAVFWCPP